MFPPMASCDWLVAQLGYPPTPNALMFGSLGPRSLNYEDDLSLRLRLPVPAFLVLACLSQTRRPGGGWRGGGERIRILQFGWIRTQSGVWILDSVSITSGRGKWEEHKPVGAFDYRPSFPRERPGLLRLLIL